MAKSLSKCLGCSQRKFVNYAGLCKRCNRDPKNAAIVEHASEEHEHELEARAESEREMEEERAEADAEAAKAEPEPEAEDEVKKDE